MGRVLHYLSPILGCDFMSLKTKLKRALNKAHKFIIVSFCFILVFSLTVSAVSYSFPHDSIITDDTVLYVSNGKNYSKQYLPNDMVNTYDDYSVTYWSISGYNPPTGSGYENITTNVYLRLKQIGGISVKSGQRLTIKFTFKYDGLTEFDALVTRVQLRGWNTSLHKNLGFIPRDSKTELVCSWDNKNSDAVLDYLDINLLLYNNVNPNGTWVFQYWYNSLQVIVEDIPQDALTDPNYKAPDDTVINDHNTITDSIDNSTAAGRDEAAEIIGSVADLSDSDMFAGLLAWSRILNSALDSFPWYNEVLVLALAVGLFAFILGVGVYALNFSRVARSRTGKSNNRNSKGGSG